MCSVEDPVESRKADFLKTVSEFGNWKNSQVTGPNSLEQVRHIASVCMRLYARMHACVRVDGKKQPQRSQISLQRGSSLLFTRLSPADYATLK